MAIGDIKKFHYLYDGLELTVDAIDLGGGKTRMVVTSASGSADINALYWANSVPDGNVFVVPGAGLSMSDTGIDWDGGVRTSNITAFNAAKTTYLNGPGDSYTVASADVDWNTLDTVGVRATHGSNPGGDIKSVGQGSVTSVPQISIGDVTVTEGVDAQALFTVSLDQAYAYDIYVTYSSVAGTATKPADFTSLNGVVKIAAGQTSVQVAAANIVDNLTLEGTEDFKVNLTKATADVPGADLTITSKIVDSQGIGTILDNDVALISVSDVTVNENAGTMTFTITKTGGVATSVQYAISNGTAVLGSDFTQLNANNPLSGTLNFTAGQISKTVTVRITNDNIHELSENLVLNLSNATSGATIADSNAVGIILDNDAAPVITINDVEVSEDAGTITFTVTKTGNTSVAASLQYQVNHGTASINDVNGELSGTIDFAANETEKLITLSITDDSVFDGFENETFTIDLSGAVNATIGDSQGVGSIVDNEMETPHVLDDQAVLDPDTRSVSVNVLENDFDGDGDPLLFNVWQIFDGPTAQMLNNGYTAQFGSDGTLTVQWSGGLPEQDLNLQFAYAMTDINGNFGTTEAGEIWGKLDIAVPAAFRAPDVVDDPVEITEHEVVAGNLLANDSDPDGQALTLTSISIEINAGEGPTQYYFVNYPGQIDGEGYLPIPTATGVLRFRPDGAYTYQHLANVPPGEQLNVAIGYTVSDGTNEVSGTADVTINGENAAPVAVDDLVSGYENNHPSLNMETLLHGNYLFNDFDPDGDALHVVKVNGEDFPDGGLSIPQADGTHIWLNIGPNGQYTIYDMNTVDLAEGEVREYSFTYQLADEYGALSNEATAIAAVRGLAPETVGLPFFEISEDVTLNEGESTTLTVTRSHLTQVPATVEFVVSPGTADGSDYSDATGTLVFAEGETTKTITVNTTDDGVEENEEHFFVNLFNPNTPHWPGAAIGKGSAIVSIGQTDAPVALDDVTFGYESFYVSMDGGTLVPGNYLTNDQDVDGDPMHLVTINGMAAEAFLQGDGRYHILQESGGQIMVDGFGGYGLTDYGTALGIEIPAGEVREYSFTYQVADMHGAVSNEATARLFVTGVDENPLVPPVFSIDDVTVNEADGIATFTVTNNAVESLPLFGGSVDYTINGLAVSDGGGALSGTLLFEAGEVSKQITLDIVNDGIGEVDKQFTVDLFNPLSDPWPNHAFISDGQGIGTIIDDDPLPAFNVVGDPVVNEADGSITFTVTKTGPETAAVVDWGVSSGSAQGWLDFWPDPPNGTLNFAPNQTVAEITIGIVNDNVREAVEYFNFFLQNPFDGRIQDGQGIGTIIDEDLPQISVDDVEVLEGGIAGFTISLDEAYDQDILVNWNAVPDTARMNIDYQNTGGVSTIIPAGETEVGISVETLADLEVEPDEQFYVQLQWVDTYANTAPLAKSVGIGTLHDNTVI